VALSTVTVQPNSSSQLGIWNVVGAASGWQAVSDGSDNSYVQLSAGLCKLDSQVVRFGFPAISIPSGSQIYSVGLRRRIQCVIAGHQVPQCLHWFRSVVGLVEIAGQLLQVFKTPFSSLCPTDLHTTPWTTESVFTATLGPDGQAWSLIGNLESGNFFYDMGRGDSFLFSPLRISEVWLDVTYQQVSGITVTGPSGVTPDTQPTITWTYFSADSQPQQAYQTAVYTLAQTQTVGFVPFSTTPIDGTNGFVLGEDQQWAMSIDITNGQYVAYVQAQATWGGPGNFLSTVGSTSWTRSATGPPQVAVFTSAEFDAESNRVALTFQPGGTTPPTTQFSVYASRDGGQSFNPIPSLTYVPALGLNPVTVYDYVAPLNTVSQYRVISYGGTPLQAAGAPSGVLSVTPLDNRFWLKNPANYLLNTVLPVAAPKQTSDGIKITKRRMQGTFQLLGSQGSQQLPFIVSGPTYGDEYQIELIFIEDDPNTPMTLYTAVDELDRTGGAMLLQKPDGDQLWVVTGPGASGQETEENYYSIAGDPTVNFWRRRKLVLTQVDPPAYY
jgi:hypothetical protein